MQHRHSRTTSASAFDRTSARGIPEDPELLYLRQRVAELEIIERDHRRALSALQLSEARYRSFLEHFHGIIYLANMDFEPIFFHGLIEKITGYPESTFICNEICWEEVVHPDDRAYVAATNEQLLAGQETLLHREYRIVRKDGIVRWMYEELNKIIGNTGVLVMIQSVLTDITERKLAEDQLQQGLLKLGRVLEGTAHALAATAERRDPFTAGHQQRAADLACSIAKLMGMPANETEGLRLAGLLHDIGKIAVPIEILSKPTKLSEFEFSIIKTHPQVSYEILKDIDFPWPVAEIARQHHWCLDGSGYPAGYSSDAHLLEAKILTVADVIEAISSHRPYRPALGIDVALEEVQQHADVLYDREVVQACIELFTTHGYSLD